MRRKNRRLAFRGSRRVRDQRRLRAERLENRLLLTTVTSVDPAANSFGSPLGTNVSATFDQDVTAATDETFVLHTGQGGRLAGGDTTVSTSGATATHDPTNNFFAGELVQATVTSGVTTAGGAANARVWSFRAGVGGGLGTFTNSGQFIGDAAANRISRGIQLGDLDGDGDLDMVVANDGSSSRAYLNDGSGIFADSGQDLGTATRREVELADLDGDGDMDAVIVGNGANARWMNDGTGVLSEAQTFGGNNSFDVAVGDVDADGDIDVFVANQNNPNGVYLNDGTGNLSGGASLGDHASRGVELGDVDGDGDLDAYVINFDRNSRLWLNNGSGTFSDSGQLMGDHESNGVALGDLDGDGDLDAIVANQVNADRIWFNDGTGVFTDSGQLLKTVATGNADDRGIDWILGDVDSDGDLDGIVGQFNGDGEHVYLNDGAGIFTDSGQRLGGRGIGVGDNTEAIAMGDVDGDGDLDLVTANSQGFNPSLAQTKVFLNDNPANQVTLSIDPASIAEDGGVATITATSSSASGSPVTVSLGVSGTATETDDFTLSASEIVIPANETTASITVTAVQDPDDEPDETVIIDITGVTGGSEAGTQQVTATILDDDEPAPVPDVTLSVDNASIAEDGGVATFTVTLSEVTTVPVTVELGVSGSAAASDFALSATEVVVSAGETSGSVTVTAVQDGDDEADETVTVEIIAVTNGTELGTQEATTAIADDDEPVVPDVSLSVDNASIPEDGGVATFTATLSETTTVDVTVNLESSGAATAGDDYTLSGTQVVIAAGETSGSVTVTAVQDEFDEPDESVVVSISGVTNGNEDGEQSATTNIADDDEPTGFAVTELTPTSTGFQASFTNPIDTADLNLYDTQAAGMGEADATLTGDASGPIQGSLLVTGPRSVQFIATGGPLAADTYTVELRSAADGFEDDGGLLLDGNGDGTGGDNFTSSFVVEEPAANSITIGIPDVVRGPGQDVNLPADTELGIPLTISNGDNVRAIDLRISYDPSLLTITGASAGEDAPGATPVLNTTTPGLAILVFFSSNSLPAGEGTFVNLSATVPSENASETYRAQQVLDVHNVVISDGNDNEFPVVVDDALHVNTFFADVSGNGRINAADAAGVARIAALIDSGFGTLLSTDPTVVGDISGNGRLNAADASLVAQFAALIPVPQIPAVPGDVTIAGVPNPGEEGTEDRGGSQAGLLDAVSDDLTFRVVDNFVSQSADSFDTDAVDSAVADGDDFLGDLLEDLL